MDKLIGFIIKEMEQGNFRLENVGTNIYFVSDKIKIEGYSTITQGRIRNPYIEILNSDILPFRHKDLGLSWFKWQRLMNNIRMRMKDPKQSRLESLSENFEIYINNQNS